MQTKTPRPKTIAEYVALSPSARAAYPESTEFVEALDALAGSGVYTTEVGGSTLIYVLERRGSDVVGLLSADATEARAVVRDSDDEIACVHGIAQNVRHHRAAAAKPTAAGAAKVLRWDPRLARNPHPHKPHPWELDQPGPHPAPAPESPLAPTRGQLASAVVDQSAEIQRLDTALAAQGAQIAKQGTLLEALSRDIGALVAHMTAPPARTPARTPEPPPAPASEPPAGAYTEA